MIEAEEFIAAELDVLRAEGRQVDLSVEPFGYGIDLVCVNDITPDAAELDPDGTFGIAQDLYHRLITGRGFLIDDPDYGYDLLGLLHAAIAQKDLAMAAAQITGECSKDDRVAVAVTTITPENVGKLLRIRIEVTPEDPAVKPFSMIIAVTDGQTLLEVTTAKAA